MHFDTGSSMDANLQNLVCMLATWPRDCSPLFNLIFNQLLSTQTLLINVLQAYLMYNFPHASLAVGQCYTARKRVAPRAKIIKNSASLVISVLTSSVNRAEAAFYSLKTTFVVKHHKWKSSSFDALNLGTLTVYSSFKKHIFG